MATIPVVDISGLRSSKAEQRQPVVDQLMKAATEIGFLQVDRSSPLLALISISLP